MHSKLRQPKSNTTNHLTTMVISRLVRNVCQSCRNRRPLLPALRNYAHETSTSSVSRVVSARGVDFHVEHCNPGAPHPILCLPGALGTAKTDFPSLLQGALGPKYSVVSLDPRGLGESRFQSSGERLLRPYPLDFYWQDALDAHAVMNGLGYSSFDLMGWSDGAISAIHMAGRDETKVSVNKMIIWGANSYFTKADVDAWESVRDVSNWSERMRNERSTLHGGLESLQRLNNDATDAWVSIYRYRAGDACLEELHKITCPTLIVHGEKDFICDMKHAKYIHRQIQNSSLVIFPEGKHNLHLRLADKFNALVGSFLKNDHDRGNADDSAEEYGPDIEQIAYAFMGSKTLFVALRAGLFDAIDSVVNSHPTPEAPFQQIEEQCAIKGERLKTLLNACVSLKLISRQFCDDGGEVFTLPRSTTDQLVRSSKRYWGDYISGQVGGQFYTRMLDLEQIMETGTAASHGYEAWFEKDPDSARRYTRAQHNGSLATGFALWKRFRGDLAQNSALDAELGETKLLDVGGGSGAFSLAAVKTFPQMTAVVLDLPNVIAVAEDVIDKQDEAVRDRLSTLALSATAPGDWRGRVLDNDFDVVLVSYVSGSIPLGALPGMYANAFRALKPGGRIVVHDFFVDNSGEGPTNAALWALAHVSVNPEGMGLRPNRIVDMLGSEGFIGPHVDDLIPGTTQMIVATKPIDYAK